MLAFDALEFNAPTVREIDPQTGYLKVALTNIAKEGVRAYRGSELPRVDLDQNKIYYVFTPGEELKKAAHTFNGIPVLSEHALDNAYEPSEFRIGATGSIAQYNAPYLQNALYIYNQEDIEDIYDGVKKELSPGYKFEMTDESGVYNGQRYDFTFRDIHGMHEAIVREGRAGKDVYIADAAIDIDNTDEGEQKMSKRKQTSFRGIVNQKIALDAFDITKAEAIIEEFPEEHRESILEAIRRLEEIRDEDFKEVEIKEKIDDEDFKEVKVEEKIADEELEEKVKIHEEPSPSDIVNEAVQIILEVEEAKKDVAEVLGNDISKAFDSKEKIYGLALDELGFNTKNYKPSAYEGMFKVYKELKKKNEAQSVAMDSSIEHPLKDFINMANSSKRGY